MRVACIAYLLLFSFASRNKEKWKPKVKVGLADDEKSKILRGKRILVSKSVVDSCVNNYC